MTGTAAATAYPITVEHAFGTTTIDARPIRVATIGLQWTDVLLALGDSPLVYVADPMAGPGDIYPWQRGRLDGATALAISAAGDIPYEQLAALDPDLILVTFLATDQAVYDRLNAIAPTIGPLGERQVDRWQDMIEVAGRILGEPARATDVVSEVDAVMAEAAAAYPGLEDKTFALANFVPGDSIYVVADEEDGSSVFFQALGMQLDPDVLAAADGVSGRANISLEQVDLLDGDLLVIFSNDADPSTLVGYDQLGAVTPRRLGGARLRSRRRPQHADAAVDPVLAGHRPAATGSGSCMSTTEDDPIAAFVAASGSELLERLNDDFEDSMVFVARVLAARPAARRAVVRGLDRHGIDLLVGDDAGEHTQRIEFAEPVSDPMALTGALFELVGRARAVSGEAGQTTAERNMVELAAIRTFLTTVSSVVDVHPHLRRITFAGGDLATFAPIGPDTFCYLLLPPPGSDTLAIDNTFTWEQHANMSPEEQPVGAYYTVRSWRPEVAELDMLFVLHGDGARVRLGGPCPPRRSRRAVGSAVRLPPAGGRDVDAARRRRDRPARRRGDPRAAPGRDAGHRARRGRRRRRAPGAAGARRHHRHVAPPRRTAGRDDDAARRRRRRVGVAAGEPLRMGRRREPRDDRGAPARRDVRGLDRAHVSLVAYWRHTPAAG